MNGMHGKAGGSTLLESKINLWRRCKLGVSQTSALLSQNQPEDGLHRHPRPSSSREATSFPQRSISDLLCSLTSFPCLVLLCSLHPGNLSPSILLPQGPQQPSRSVSLHPGSGIRETGLPSQLGHLPAKSGSFHFLKV